mgnify:CR=1 FL=1
MTIPWLLLLLICTEPYPPECSRPSIDEITSNPVCIAASKSCTLHQEWVYVDATLRPKAQRDACVDRAAALFAEELKKGYRRGQYPECSPKENEP